jgi:hypothetical protein
LALITESATEKVLQFILEAVNNKKLVYIFTQRGKLKTIFKILCKYIFKFSVYLYRVKVYNNLFKYYIRIGCSIHFDNVDNLGIEKTDNGTGHFA